MRQSIAVPVLALLLLSLPACSKDKKPSVKVKKAPKAVKKKASPKPKRPTKLVFGYPSLKIERHAKARRTNLAGLKAHRRKEHETALKLFTKAAELDPEFHMARFNAACALTLLKRDDEALFLIEELLSLDLVRYQRLLRTDGDLASLREGQASRIEEIVESAVKRYRELLARPGPRFIAFRGRYSDVWQYDLASERFIRLTDSRRTTVQWGIDRKGSYLVAVVARHYKTSKEVAICDLDELEVLKVKLSTLAQSKKKELATEPTGPVPELFQADDGKIYAFGEPWGYMRIAFAGGGHNDEVEGKPKGAKRMAMTLPDPGPAPLPLKLKIRGKRIFVEGQDKPLVPPRLFDKESLSLSPDRRYMALRRAFSIDCDKDDLGVYPEGYLMVADLSSGEVKVIHKGKGRLRHYWIRGVGLVIESGIERTGTSVLLWQPGREGGEGTTKVLAGQGSLQEYALHESCGA